MAELPLFLSNFADDFEINSIFLQHHIMMKMKISACAIALSVIGLFASCLSDGENSYTTTVYEDTAINSFTLGTVTIKTPVGKKKYLDEDSVVTTTYAGNNVKVVIDQLGREVFNVDSLPAYSYMKFLATVNAKNSGTLKYQKWTDKADTDPWTIYSVSDSIDFNNELRFRVTSSSGEYHRDYKVTIVAHTEQADSFVWKALPAAAQFAEKAQMKGAVTTKALYVLADGTLYKSANVAAEGKAPAFGEAWTEVAGVTGNSLVSMRDTLFVYGGGVLTYLSADGSKIDQKSVAGITEIIGGCNGELYGLTAGGIMVNRDRISGAWEMDELEGGTYYSNAGKLPAKNISYAALTTTTDAKAGRIALVGNMADDTMTEDTCAVVWSKYVDTHDAEPWSYVASLQSKNTSLPRLSNLSATSYYNGWILAIGGKGLVPGVKTNGYDKVYCSEDGGISWFTKKGLRLPSAFSDAKPTIIVADHNYFYLISADGGKVYRGKLNNATWKQTSTTIK